MGLSKSWNTKLSQITTAESDGIHSTPCSVRWRLLSFALSAALTPSISRFHFPEGEARKAGPTLLVSLDWSISSVVTGSTGPFLKFLAKFQLSLPHFLPPKPRFCPCLLRSIHIFCLIAVWTVDGSVYTRLQQYLYSYICKGFSPGLIQIQLVYLTVLSLPS